MKGELKLFADWVCHTRFISLSCLGGNWRTPGVELNIKLKLNEARVEQEEEGAVSAHHLLANCRSRRAATVWPHGGSKY